MISWKVRSQEERSLLNPCFCANLLWHAASGYASEVNDLISLEESFLVLPFVLQKSIRDALPRSTRTSLAVWIQDNPLARGRIGTRAEILVPYTKEALLFAGVRGFITHKSGKLHANLDQRLIVNRVVRDSTDEVQDCAKRSLFVGRWFAQTGGPTTVLALLGVRP